MNNKIKRSIAVALTAAAICNPVSTMNVFSAIYSNPVIASAASYHLSGYTNYEFKYESADKSYELYFNIKDANAKTAVVYGSWTTKENTDIKIPEKATFRDVEYTITEIGQWAFDETTNIKSVLIPKTVTKINCAAFIDCTNLNYVGCIDACNITEIGEEAFYNCEKLVEPRFLSQVKTIGDSAFEGCQNLYEIYDMPKLTSMGKYAFANCPNINKIDLSKTSLTSIPDYAFRNSCSDSYGLNVKLPSTVKTIGKGAFYNVKNLKLIDLSNVTRINDNAFQDCHDLKTVFTNDKLSYIGNFAFCGCDPMTYFVCKNDKVTIGVNALGYDHKKYYTKKSDFTLWGGTGSGNMSKYALSQGFTYKNTKVAASEVINKFAPYMWTCGKTTGNCKEMFAETNGNYLFIDGHKSYVDAKHLNEKFSGSCGGMATISALVYNGDLAVNQFAPGYSTISSLTTNCSRFTKSFINTIWNKSSGTPRYRLSHSDGTAKFSAADDEMLKYIEYITYGEDVAVVTYGMSSNDENQHSIVCLGMEDKANASDQNNQQWDGMDRRILLYDVNNKSFDTAFCLYFNSKTGDWRMGNGNLPAAYNPVTKPNFYFALKTDPSSMISGGMDIVNTLLSIKK